MEQKNKPTVLTGAQPTSLFHLGNYMGAIKNWVELAQAQSHECFFCVVDMHSITMPYKPAELRKNSVDCVALYLASGIDPEKASIFIQSHVTGHTDLSWILSAITPLGQLQRMTQFKDKSKKSGDFINAGLLFYPVLQTADILLYNANLVPVGEDQKQHLELARDTAQRFNQTYSETFNLPEPFIPKHGGARIMSLQDPSAKMSKSDPNQNSNIFLLDPIDLIRKKIGSAVTDSGNEIKASDEKPGVKNLLNILSSTSGKSVSDLENHFAGKSYADFKSTVADAVIATVEPIQKRYNEIIKDKSYLESVIKAGAESAQKKAYKTLSKVYRKVGFVERIR